MNGLFTIQRNGGSAVFGPQYYTPTSAQLSCTVVAASSATLSLSTHITLSVSCSGAAQIVATLASSAINLAASVQSTSTVSATLNTAIRFSAALQSASSASAVLSSTSVPAQFSASFTSQCFLQGTLTNSQAVPMFIPSTARTINIMAVTPVFTGGKYWNFTDPKKPRGTKDPDSTIDITFNWSDWLADIGSATISDVTFTLFGVDSVGSFSDGVKTTVFVTGGTDGSSAQVACKITTNTTPSRTDERTIYLDIGEE
jgi:hypothetical protein